MVSSARMRPGPGVAMSSASVATGSSPPNPGSERTRERLRENPPGPRTPRPTRSTAGVVNIVPPGRSRLPVRRLRAWTAHWQSTPNDWVDTPIRPWTAAEGAAARSRARRRTSSALTPLTRSASSGVNGSTAARTASRPSTQAGGVARSATRSSRTIARRTAASEPGRTKRCSSAIFAVSVRRGSRTTSRPPREASSRRRCGKSGTVHSEPFDAIGLWPTRTRRSVRSMSGTGRRNWWP